MRDPIGKVPDGYAVHRVADSWLVIDRDRASELVRLRLADARARDQLFDEAPLRGRGRAPAVVLAPGLRVVLRRYRHGGIFGSLTRSLLLGPERATAELRVCAAAETAGAPVPRVLCVAAWPVIGPFWSALIGTEEITGASDLLERASRSTATGNVALAQAVGAAVRALHDAGIEHRDLQLRNILVREQTGSIVIIDLDRALFHGTNGVPVARRAQNLGRLARSAIKNRLWNRSIGPRERAAFAHGYTRGDRALRSELRRFAGRERCKLTAHRLSWPLRAALSAQPAAAPPRPA